MIWINQVGLDILQLRKPKPMLELRNALDRA